MDWILRYIKHNIFVSYNYQELSKTRLLKNGNDVSNVCC